MLGILDHCLADSHALCRCLPWLPYQGAWGSGKAIDYTPLGGNYIITEKVIFKGYTNSYILQQ
jgi:hypothetical protein